MAKLILDLEMLMTWWVTRENEKKHLVYCDIVVTDISADDNEDISIGIGQKVTEVGKKMKKYIKDV